MIKNNKSDAEEFYSIIYNYFTSFFDLLSTFTLEKNKK